MAYFDEDDPIRTQLADKFNTSGLGPTITVDSVTGETSLGAKKNPTARDWQKAYEGYIGKGGSPLTPTGMAATKMYQHPIFQGRGLSYYASEPFKPSFIADVQRGIQKEEPVTPTDTVATSAQQLMKRQLEPVYQDDEGGSPPSDPEDYSEDWSKATGPELFTDKQAIGPTSKHSYSPLDFVVDSFKDLGKDPSSAITSVLKGGVLEKMNIPGWLYSGLSYMMTDPQTKYNEAMLEHLNKENVFDSPVKLDSRGNVIGIDPSSVYSQEHWEAPFDSKKSGILGPDYFPDDVGGSPEQDPFTGGPIAPPDQHTPDYDEVGGGDDQGGGPEGGDGGLGEGGADTETGQGYAE